MRTALRGAALGLLALAAAPPLRAQSAPVHVSATLLYSVETL